MARGKSVKRGNEDDGKIEEQNKLKKSDKTDDIKDASKSKKSKETLKEKSSKILAKELLSMMKDGTVISVKSHQSLYEGLLVLQEHKIISAPVYDEKLKQYIGFVDMVDLVSALVESAKETGAYKSGSDQQDIENENLDQRIIIDNFKLKSLIDFSKRDDFIGIKTNDSVLKAAEILSQKDHHRCAIFDENSGDLVGIVTQTGLVEYFSEEFSDILQSDKTTVDSITQSKKEVFTVKSDCKAIDAFNLINQKKVSGVGIVDENGMLIDTISVSDIMVWSEWNTDGEIFRFPNLTSLSLSVTDFLENSRAQREVPTTRKVKSVLGDELVHDVMNEMLIENIHRIFLLDTAKKPLDVITYSNIISHYLTI